MEDKTSVCLAMMNSTKKGNEFPIYSTYYSLIDMINSRGMNILPILILTFLIMVILSMIKKSWKKYKNFIIS